MGNPHKPEGYPDASAYLIVDDAQTVLDFLAATFVAEPLRVIPREGGGIMHAEARIGDSVVMMKRFAVNLSNGFIAKRPRHLRGVGVFRFP